MGETDSFSFEALAGDVLSLAVDSPDSNLDPHAELRNSANGLTASDEDGGPGSDALLSRFAITSSGQYSVRVLGRNSTTGAYQLRVDLARSVQLESDANYSNDTVAGANPLTLTTAGNQRSGTLAGTIMDGQSGNVDEDYWW